MLVKFGNYKNYWGPYQIAELLCFWAPRSKDTFSWNQKPDWVHDFGTWLAQDKHGNDSWLTKLCEWISSKRQRQVYVHIDKWDSWSADHTLSLIALPLLKQLQKSKHGAPQVDDGDVPEHLHRSAAPAVENEYDTDENWFKRWDWVLSEMIWAHEQTALDDPEIDAATLPEPWPFPQEQSELFKNLGINPGPRPDFEKIAQIQERKQNAFRLFGKYYQALWD
jgi:hypothetical protein